MARSFLNPKQSDYRGRYRLAAGTMAVGAVSLFIGLSSNAEPIITLLSSAGVALLIGGGFVWIGAWRSQSRADAVKRGQRSRD